MFQWPLDVGTLPDLSSVVPHLAFPRGYTTMWLFPWCIWCYLPPPLWTGRRLWKHYLPATWLASGDEINYEISFLAIPITWAKPFMNSFAKKSHNNKKNASFSCLAKTIQSRYFKILYKILYVLKTVEEDGGVDTVCIKVYCCLGSLTLKNQKLFSAGDMWFWASSITQKKPIVSLGVLT